MITGNRADINPLEWHMRILSQNVDDHPGYRIPDHPKLGYVSYAFPELAFKNRFALFEKFYHAEIHEKHVNLFLLQELGDDAKEAFKLFFAKNGFDCIASKYNSSKDAVNYLFAYKKADYEIKNQSQIYFTKSGKTYTDEERTKATSAEKLEHNFGLEFERSAQVITLSQLHNKNAEIIIVNIQPGLTNNHRELVMANLCEHLKNEARPVLIVGDFNQFDSSVKESKVYLKQIQILEHGGFYWATRHLMDEGIQSTFVAHPYDILRFLSKEDFDKFEILKSKKDAAGIRDLFRQVIEKNKIDMISTCLDGLFVRGIDTAQVKTTTSTWFDGKLTHPTTINRVAFQESYLAKCSIFSTQQLADEKPDTFSPPIVSDHLAVEVDITFKR